MDEIEYKLKTNTSVLIVNAVDKLISTIKSKYKPAERPKFVLENEELKFLREKCSSPDPVVSLTACQGLLALVELNVLEIGHTMSTVVSLLPTAHNFSAIISTMAGLLVLDLKSRLIPGQPYKCQFSLRSPQHPFITILEKNKDIEDNVLAQMHALCTSHEYLVSSNSLELLRPVFLWLTSNPQRSRSSSRVWQLLLSLPQSDSQSSLLLACLSSQQICNPKLLESSVSAYSAVTEAAIYQQRREYIVALVPMLATICSQLLKHGRDPRPCYILIDRCFSMDVPELKCVSGLTLIILADNLTETAALYLHELFNLCLNIISKYDYSTVCLNSFVGLSLQWLHLPSYLTTNALNTASKILDIQQQERTDNFLYIANLKSNKTFQNLVQTERHLHIYFKLLETWERLDNPDKLKSWFDVLCSTNDDLKVELLPFLVGLCLNKTLDEEVVVKVIQCIVQIVRIKKEVSVTILPVLVHKLADKRPYVKLACLKGLPIMASTKENVPTLVAVLNKLKANKGVPTSLLIELYTSLAETQVRCFPYLQELLVDTAMKPDDLKWEIDLAKSLAVKRICEARASSHGLELVSVISSLLNRCTDKSGGVATSLALAALAALWRGAAVAPPGTWRALEPRLGRDTRPAVQVSLCKLLAEIPALRVPTPEYDKLVSDAAKRLWVYLAEGISPVCEAACHALANYKIEDFKLKDIPEIYIRTVKLPPSYCKTPADAMRRPEDVLDYIPCEVWPELFKSNSSLTGVEYFVGKLIEREIKGFRSGVYMIEGREPLGLTNLPPHSVLRAMTDCVRKQILSPTYDIQESVLLSMVSSLSREYARPLPPFDLSFLHDVWHRGTLWRSKSVELAARQALTVPSAKRLLDNWLAGIQPGSSEETDIMLIFEYLPILARTMPPNNLRYPVENCLAEAFSHKSECFVNQLRLVRDCLECERIHEANRTWLCQAVEGYFSLINEDSPLWPEYVECSLSLSTKYLERMTSPSGWWEVSSDLLRKSMRTRSALAARSDTTAPLVWLNESIDAHAQQILEQDYSLRCIMEALKVAKQDDPSTKHWFLQLMARTQVAFNEMEDESSKLYLCDVFMLSSIMLSGLWSFEPEIEAVVSSRANRQTLMPAALASLLNRDAWKDCTLQMLEWLCHTRDATKDEGTSRACQRTLLALRHSELFITHKIWTRLEHHFGNLIPTLED
ncbi:focadhesin [Pieris brassicae]|uniref:focadhesin n=1 Tax=Pieris brassicae TaxID=7116 RepID=UPI001E6621EE|nr:focadhesin [Pieris brassicae]